MSRRTARPGEPPLAADEYGTTVAEMAAGEPLDLRLSREEPDVLSLLGTEPPVRRPDPGD